jgi:hypothetical protein
MFIKTYYPKLLLVILLMTSVIPLASAAPTPFEILTGTGEAAKQPATAKGIPKKPASVDQVTWDRFISLGMATMKDSAVKEAVAKLALAKTDEEKRVAHKLKDEAIKNAMLRMLKADPTLMQVFESLDKAFNVDKNLKPFTNPADILVGSSSESSAKPVKKSGVPRPESIDSATWKRFIEASKISAADPAVISAKNLVTSAKNNSERSAALKSYNDLYKAGILKVDPAFSTVFKAIDEAKAKPKSEAK